MNDEEKLEYFWQQYEGLVRAIDLPQDYKIKDKRISCVNGYCHLRNKCLFYARYRLGLHYASNKTEMRDIIDQQNGKMGRNTWDKNYPKPNYFNSSFQFYVEQNGVTCKYFVEDEYH